MNENDKQLRCNKAVKTSLAVKGYEEGNVEIRPFVKLLGI